MRPVDFKLILVWCLAQAESARLAAYHRNWRAANKERRKRHTQAYYKAHREECNARCRQWEQNNREKSRAMSRASKLRNPDMWRANNRERARATARQRDHSKRASDPVYRLAKNVRRQLWRALMGLSKNQRTIELVGCSWLDLKNWLQSKFEPGMNWGNYGQGVGKWEIDHRVPCSEFDLTNPSQIQACFHFSNLQPMWSKANKAKGARIGLEFQNLQPTLPV